MKRYVQTPESVKNLFLLSYENFIPELRDLESYPILLTVEDGKLAWIWKVSEKMFLSYFAGEIKILDKLPERNSLDLNKRDGATNGISTMSVYYHTYLAEYQSSDIMEDVRNMILELKFNNVKNDCLIKLFDQGFVFEVFEEDQITELSLAEWFELKFELEH